MYVYATQKRSSSIRNVWPFFFFLVSVMQSLPVCIRNQRGEDCSGRSQIGKNNRLQDEKNPRKEKKKKKKDVLEW